MKIRISTSNEASETLLLLQENYPNLSLTQIANKLLADIPTEELLKCLETTSHPK